jgi:cytochrome P450 family 3 subfamily A
VNFLADFFRNARKVRLAEAFRQNDFMDKFVDMMDKLNTEEFNRLKITEDIVLGQIVVPLLAGYDAIATAFSFLSYYAATEPGVQQRIQEEVDSYFQRHEEFKYENIGELEYLNACVLETLRLVPSFIRPERICTKDWEYNWLRIPKGCIVMIPAWAANRNPEVYSDPEKFYPDRFLGDDGKNLNPYGFSTFGHGPRNCIGRKFAIDAIKIVLFHVFRKFRFEAREDTRVTYKTGKVILAQTNPIYLDVLLR